MCQIKLIYDAATSLYNVATIGMTWAFINRVKTMTKSETFEQNSLGTQISNSMPINRAANYHNVAGISQRKGV
jgi:hypothetical protein